MIYTDFAEFKSFIGGGVNYSVELDSLLPTIQEAAEQYIAPWLTEAVWDELVADFEADNLSIQQEDLLPYVRRPLAYLAMYEYSKIAGIQMSEAGMMRVESDTHKTAFKYQEAAYREAMRETGFNALAKMLEFLDTNAEFHTTWRDDGGRLRYRTTLLHRHTDMSDILGRTISRYTFQQIRPILLDVETFAFQPLLGEDQLEELRDHFRTNTLSAAETSLLTLMRKASANFAFAEAIKRMYVQVKGEAIVHVEAAADQSLRTETTAALSPAGLLIDVSSEWANRHFSYLQNYLQANAADFPLYEAYQAEQTEAAEAAATELTDERAATTPLDGVIDRNDYCKPRPLGVVRL